MGEPEGDAVDPVPEMIKQHSKCQLISRRYKSKQFPFIVCFILWQEPMGW
jgi:hypothetical protein